MQQIYRFEVASQRGRHGTNVVYEAVDPFDGTTVLLCEWTPAAGEAAQAAATLTEVRDALSRGEVFSSGAAQYLAVAPEAARVALAELRARGIFGGSWPGLIDEAPAVREPEREPEPKPEPESLPPIDAPEPEPFQPPPQQRAQPPSSGSRSGVWTAVSIVLGIALVVLVVLVVQINNERARIAAETEARAKAEAAKAEEAARFKNEQDALRTRAIGFFSGMGGTFDSAKAAALFQEGDQKGDLLARMWLARAYFRGLSGFRAQPAAGATMAAGVMTHVRALSDAANPEAMFLMASAFQEGLGVTPDEAQATALYERSCAGGMLLACNNLANGVLYPPGATEAPAAAAVSRATELYKRGCDGQVFLSCVGLASMHEAGHLQPAEEAQRFYEKACNGNYLPGCVSLGRVYARRDGAGAESAMSLYQRACTGGNMSGCDEAGLAYESRRDAPSYVEAVGLYRRACDGEYLLGCAHLGWLYQHGSGGVARDPVQAANLYRSACDGDVGYGCLRLGLLYAPNGALPPDTALALEHLTKSCALRYADGCSDLGWVNETVVRDFTKAAGFYDQACQMSSRVGCTNFGALLESGNGVQQDVTRAVDVYRRACELGDGRGCFNLGRVQENDRGLLGNLPAAREAYAKGCDFGFQDACASRDRMGRE